MASIQNDYRTRLASRYTTVEMPTGRDIKLHYLDSWPKTAAPPPLCVLVFVHGLGANAHTWTPIMEEIAFASTTTRCVALDLPGHGKSHGYPNANIYDCIHAIDQFLNKLPNCPLHLVGHSFGAGLLIHSQTNPLHSARIRQYHLIAPVGIQRLTAWQRKLTKSIYDLNFLLKMGKKGAYSSFCKYFVPYRPDYDHTWKHISADIEKDPEAYFTTINTLANSLMDSFELNEPTIFERIQFILGNDDIVVPSRAFSKNLTAVDLMEQNRDYFPNSKWFFLDQCGHYPQIEHTVKIANLIISTL